MPDFTVQDIAMLALIGAVAISFVIEAIGDALAKRRGDDE